MDEDVAKIIVQTYAILGLISATLCILLGVAMIVGGSFLGPALDSLVSLESIGINIQGIFGSFSSMFYIIGFLLVILGAVEFYANIALWRHKEWARIMMIVNSVFSVLSVFTFPVGTLFGALGIYLFGFDATVKSLFVHVDPKIPVKKVVIAPKMKQE